VNRLQCQPHAPVAAAELPNCPIPGHLAHGRRHGM
jgi:hypothetical protein